MLYARTLKEVMFQTYKDSSEESCLSSTKPAQTIAYTMLDCTDKLRMFFAS